MGRETVWGSSMRVIVKGMIMAGLLMSARPAFPAGSDDGFVAFWAQFKAAVSKEDQNAVSQMINYPVLYIDIRKASEFPVIWKGAFKPAHRKCLAKQKPVKDTNEGKVSYSAFCDDIIYSFTKVDADWKLTDLV